LAEVVNGFLTKEAEPIERRSSRRQGAWWFKIWMSPARRELHESLVRSEHVVLDGASHLSNIERPDGFSAVVVDFLARFSEEYQAHAAA